MDQRVEIENAQVVEQFEFDFSQGPGVYELRGTKGTGKTTILKSLDLLAGRKVQLTVTDGETSGCVRGFGVVAPIGGKRRRKGDFELDVLESETFSLEDIVAPPIKDPVAADAHRIKAIVSLRQVVAEPADYYELAGGRVQLEKLVGSSRLQTDDPILLATRVKSAFEAEARKAEEERDVELRHADRHKVDGVDLSQPSDSRTLQAAYDAVKATQTSLESVRDACQQREKERDEARKSLATTTCNYTGPSVEDAEGEYIQSVNRKERASTRVNALKYELKSAEHEEKLAKEKVTHAEQSLQTSKQHEQMCAAWKASIESPSQPAPDEDQISEASIRVEEAKQALEYGVKVRDALQSQKQAKIHADAAKVAGKRAARWRELAASTFDTLTQLVQCSSIRIESREGAPRTVVDHPRRGKTLFHELSDGEKVRCSIDAILDRLRSPSLLTIGQRTWQDLPPTDRSEIAQYAKTNGIYAVAAQVSDGPLCVVYYSAESA